MEPALVSPASAALAGIPARLIFILIPLVGIGVFAYIMHHRVAPLLKAAPDNRLERIPERVRAVLTIWLAQWRHPRYLLAGVLHIVVFLGFLVLGARSTQLVVLGFVDGFTLPGFGGSFGAFYHVLKDFAGTAVFVAVIILAIRRAAFAPARYAVPEHYGKDHTPEALFVLGLISTLLLSEALFDASLMAAQLAKGQPAEFAPPFTLVWVFRHLLTGASIGALQGLGRTGLDYQRRYHCCYASRKQTARYAHTHEEIQTRFGHLILQVESVPGVFSSALGDIGYIFRAPDLEQILEVVRFIHEPAASK